MKVINPKLLSNIFYKKGDVITVTQPTYLNGYITASAQDVKFDVPVPKKLDYISSISVTRLQGAIRGNKGYINGTSGWQVYSGDSNYTITASISNSGAVSIILHKSSAFTNIDNNTPLAVDVGEIRMTLS